MDGMLRTLGTDWKCYEVWFVSAFKFACFDVCQVLLACLCHVFANRRGVLNFWAADTLYHLGYHPYSNRCKNLRCRTTWQGTAVALLLLMCNSNSWTANSRKNEYSSVCTGEIHEVTWHSVYSVEFVKCNGETRLQCYGRNYCSMVEGNIACDYGLHLEAQTTPKFTLRNTRVFCTSKLPWCCAASCQLLSPSPNTPCSEGSERLDDVTS